MKKAAKKKATRAKTSRAAKKTAAAHRARRAPLESQPQSKEQAAQKAGVFLQTNDAWSLAYFDPKDLHCEERELFG
jgi:hypothetical protein